MKIKITSGKNAEEIVIDEMRIYMFDKDIEVATSSLTIIENNRIFQKGEFDKIEIMDNNYTTIEKTKGE